MTITLPRLPRRTGFALRMVRGSEVQRAATGGSISPLNRTGDHWAVEIDVRALDLLCGRALLVDIARGVGERLRVLLDQPDLDVGPIGAPVVNGDEVAGSVLPLRGLTPHVLLKKGFFLTVQTSEGSSAHMVAETVAAAADATCSVKVWPMLWRPPQDGDAVEFGAPFLEGLVVEDGGQMSGGMAVVVTDAFTIEEG